MERERFTIEMEKSEKEKKEMCYIKCMKENPSSGYEYKKRSRIKLNHADDDYSLVCVFIHLNGCDDLRTPVDFCNSHPLGSNLSQQTQKKVNYVIYFHPNQATYSSSPK